MSLTSGRSTHSASLIVSSHHQIVSTKMPSKKTMSFAASRFNHGVFCQSLRAAADRCQQQVPGVAVPYHAWANCRELFRMLEIQLMKEVSIERKHIEIGRAHV